MNDLPVELRMLQCKQLSPSSAVSLAAVMLDCGFKLMVRADGGMRLIQSKAELQELLQWQYTGSQYADNGRVEDAEWSFMFPARLDSLPGFDNGIVEIRQMAAHTNKISVYCLADFEFKDQRTFVEPLAQALRTLAEALYSVSKPEFTAVDNGNRLSVTPRDVSQTRLTTINWLNIWGPGYVARYGRDLLLRVPGHEARTIEDGAILYQLTPTFVANDANKAKEMRSTVVKHFADAGLKVRCHAPYALPPT
ncbi:hypothetical protein [Siccirubricoccus sp. G192]|uniref:hypothetical protein n=1 Tax=Siccirubricoccus sp. G192 TaxID=2849651 RepID=UPI001C2B79CC|nr:hypothetical protein [Siccirubricoccus sp. G192]MBV1800634.1 hypothetical protein [Siccirubricoccus sp. G192]MBV1800699.1 hypothetical protein [Siccirubricoccus sp. G192]